MRRSITLLDGPGAPRLAFSVVTLTMILMLNWSTCLAVERSPDKVSGSWVFRGTRVPVAALFENLESGATVDQFLEWFPGVSRQQVEVVLEHTTRSLAVA